jgi:signal transduction histidine kinase
VLASISVFGLTMTAYFIAAQTALFYLVNSLLESAFILPHYQLTMLPEALYLNYNYILALTFSLFLTGVMMIYLISYLSHKILENQRQIEALSQARVDFINQVIHEIRSPLTSVIGYTQFLIEEKLGPLAERQKEPMGVIERQGRRILDLVNDLLNLSRLEAGAVKFEKKNASLIDVAERTIEELMPQVNSRKIQLVQEFDPKTPQVIMDEAKIHEVFTNLLSNAIKFCGAGGRIFISIAPARNEVVVAVRDDGLGIDPADLPHIFERFYRASKESADRKGTGLGLTICKSIVEAHGGRIWAVSGGVGQGAVFSFALPLSS